MFHTNHKIFCVHRVQGSEICRDCFVSRINVLVNIVLNTTRDTLDPVATMEPKTIGRTELRSRLWIGSVNDCNCFAVLGLSFERYRSDTVGGDLERPIDSVPTRSSREWSLEPIASSCGPRVRFNGTLVDFKIVQSERRDGHVERSIVAFG